MYKITAILKLKRKMYSISVRSNKFKHEHERIANWPRVYILLIRPCLHKTSTSRE